MVLILCAEVCNAPVGLLDVLDKSLTIYISFQKTGNFTPTKV